MMHHQVQIFPASSALIPGWIDVSISFLSGGLFGLFNAIPTADDEVIHNNFDFTVVRNVQTNAKLFPLMCSPKPYLLLNMETGTRQCLGTQPELTGYILDPSDDLCGHGVAYPSGFDGDDLHCLYG